MKPGLQTGHVAELQWPVDPSMTITLGGARPATVFSTPNMINLMEHAAREALRPFLEEDEESVGMDVQVSHLAATPLGAVVSSTAKVTGVEKRVVTFAVAAFDNAEQIGRGTHRRAVIKMDRFLDNLNTKQASSSMTFPFSVNEDELPALSYIDVKQEGPIALVTLNRPNKLNAVNAAMTNELGELVRYLAGHKEIRVVIVTGSGNAFCAGDDVIEVGQLDLPQAEALSHQQAQIYLALERLPQTIIAAVNGPALGAGCVFAYSCDFRIAAHSATFGMPEIKLGWAPGYGVAQLTALVGKARALELCLTGKIISARQSLAWGLVNETVSVSRLMPRVRELADQLLGMPPQALRLAKRVIHADEGSVPKLAFRQDTAAYIECLKTNDAKEGIAAFAEKRQPTFWDR